MVKININNKKYKLPEELTISQWMDMMQWDFENSLHWPKIIEAACGIPAEDTRWADTEALELFVALLVTIVNTRKEVKLIDLNGISFGEFVDLDCYVALGIEKNLDKMCAIISPQAISSSEALWAIEQYTMWRTSIYRQYKVLFGLNNKDFEEWVEDKEEEDVDPMSIPRGWYKIIVELAKDDLLRIDAVTEEPLKKTLNFMADQKEKQLAAAEAARKNRQIQR